jgi:hypothetical protein
LRAALAILVVLHHAAMVYGGVPPFYYLEPPTGDMLAGLLALAFVLLNQGWFMGAFFLLAGYFTPGSVDRKGSGAFLKERLVRLGIPLLLFVFVLNPIASIGNWLMPSSLTGITTPLTWGAYPYLIGLGPLWFVLMLLIFGFGYAAWRMVAPNRGSSTTATSSPPSYLGIGLFVLALALASYLVRIIIPLGRSVNLFLYFLSFPTIAYLPQYLGFFVVGILAYRRDWFRTLPRAMGRVGFAGAVVATATLFALGFLSFLRAVERASPQPPPFGYGTWQSMVYALWDSAFAVGMCVGLIPLFRRLFGRQGPLGRFLSQQSYAVFIIHVPIVVFVAYALRGIDLAPLLKSGLAAIIVVPVCFAVAYMVRKIPGVSKVL